MGHYSNKISYNYFLWKPGSWDNDLSGLIPNFVFTASLGKPQKNLNAPPPSYDEMIYKIKCMTIIIFKHKLNKKTKSHIVALKF